MFKAELSIKYQNILIDQWYRYSLIRDLMGTRSLRDYYIPLGITINKKEFTHQEYMCLFSFLDYNSRNRAGSLEFNKFLFS